MPHILIRFFTVPDAKAARKSVVVVMVIIGVFFVMVTMLGLGAAVIATPQRIGAAGAGGNMATLLLAQVLGAEISPIFGDILFAFLAAVAFATILAVVSGVVLAAAGAIAHDIWVMIIRHGKATQAEQVLAARITAFFVGIAAIWIAVMSQTMNTAHLATLAFAMASSGVVPAVVFLVLEEDEYNGYLRCADSGVPCLLGVGVGVAEHDISQGYSGRCQDSDRRNGEETGHCTPGR